MSVMKAYCEAAAKQVAAEIETAVLSGCSKCGRRLVENDKPIEGAVVYGPSLMERIYNGKSGVTAFCPDHAPKASQ